MELYNTLSRTKEPLIIPTDRPFRLFVCGPTVYDAMHLGHARTYLVFDAFARFLRSMGTTVEYLQNITDIDDKIITRARETNVTPRILTRRYERLYHRDEARLGITSVTTYARATDYIPQIVRQVTDLLHKGYAYEVPGEGVYFDISRFSRYGALAGRTVSQAEDALSRIDESIHKRNKGDFVLWKFLPNAPAVSPAPRNRMKLLHGEPAWETTLGWGRPGWHIEDTAITEHHFGPSYDLHGGAIDLMFPHHEAEIAQQESASGITPLARTWMHTGFLLVQGKKMSKSLHNFITVDSFLADHPASLLRLLVFMHHYRSPLDYTDTLVAQTQQAHETLYEFLAKLQFVAHSHAPRNNTALLSLQHHDHSFIAALRDDFNTPGALAALFLCITAHQTILWNLSRHDAQKLHDFFISKLACLGITLTIPAIPQSIHTLLTRREKSRASQQFTKADDLRKKLEGLGYKVEDTPLGQFIRKGFRM